MASPTIQSLDRGLEILSIIARSGSPMSLNDIAGHFAIDRSSVFRLINTLVQKGFVQQDEETKRYSLGYKVLELSGFFNEISNIERLIRPILKRVVSVTHQNTHLAVIDGQEVVFLAVEQPRDRVTLNLSVGNREPLIATALGKAMLAFADEDELASVMDRANFIKYTENTIETPEKLKEVLKHVRINRVAYDNEEYKPGIVCVAAPVLDHRQHALYSIGISGPADLIRPHWEEYSRIVRDAGMEASGLLGGPVLSEK